MRRKRRPTRPEKQQQPTFAGMGGAVASEFVNTPQTPTGIKNATVDAEWAKMGLPPAMEPQRRSFGKVWDEAMAQIDHDPASQDNLIKELTEKPRALTDTEDALLLHRQIDLKNEYGKATRDLAQAYEDGRLDDVDREKQRVAGLSDKLLDLYNLNKRVGTESGRGLNARKMMAYEDFSLAQMELGKRAANEGRPLTDAERATLENQHERIVETQKAVDEHEAAAKTKASDTASKDAQPELIQEATAETVEKRRNVKAASPEEQRASAVEGLKKKASAKAPRAELTNLIQKLARAFVRDGVKERIPLVDAVHDIVKDIFPDMQWRDTMDAISGYGDFRQLSKDQISVTLRDLKGQMQQVGKLLDTFQGEPMKKTGPERRSPTATERDLIKTVNEAKERFGIRVKDPATQLKSALESLKTRLKNRTEELQDKLSRGDFSKKERVPTPMDAEAVRLKAENERAKQAYQQGLTRDRLAKRTTPQKALDFFIKLRRANLLSAPSILGKLTAAAVQRMAITPIEEAIGSGIGKVIPGVAERAPSQGGFNSAAEAKAITQGFTAGIKDAWDYLRTGKSQLDLVYGKDRGYPNEWIDFFGNLHGALKAPTKRNAFTRSFEKRMAFEIKNGGDGNDPLTQARVGMAAYEDANRAIFMQNNRVVEAYKRALGRLDQPDKTTGKVPLSSQAISTAAKTFFPIVRVPTNIVAETMEYATGAVTGSGMARPGIATGREHAASGGRRT